jgi:hypothetical protein
MTPHELTSVLSEREQIARARQSRRALFVVFVLIPGIVIGAIALLMGLGALFAD